MYRVLIPTDFSANAFRALRYGSRLFEGLRCTFYILHAYTPEIRNSRFLAPGSFDANGSCPGRERATLGLHKALVQIRSESQQAEHHYKTLLSFNLLSEEIKQQAADLDIDLILMSATGASDRDTLFMGSNGVRLVQTITRFPILLLPPEFTGKNQLTAILTTNLQRVCLPSDLRALAKNLQFVFGGNAEQLRVLPNNTRGSLIRFLQQPVIERDDFDSKEPLLLLPEISPKPQALSFN